MSPERVQLSHRALATAVGAKWEESDIMEAVRLLRAGDGKFPSGLRALPSDLIDAVQRERILVAMLRASSELGYRDLTVQDILDRSGISRPTFYENFAGKEDCFLAAFDVAAERLQKRLRAANTEGESWRPWLRTGLLELVRFIAAEPDAAWILIVEARAANPATLVRRDELLDGFAAELDSAVRADLAKTTLVSPIAAAGIVGGIEALLYNRLTRGEISELEALLPSLMYFAILSYEGRAAADEELCTLAVL